MAGLSSSDWTWAVKLEDFDADGRLDVYLTNGVPREMNHSDIKITKEMLVGKHMWEYFKDGEMRKEQNMAFRNLGDLSFSDVSQDWGLDDFGASYGAVTADFDLDGDLDIAVMNLEENVAIYRNNGSNNRQFTIELVGTRSNRNGIGAIVEVFAGGDKWIKQMSPGKGYHSYDEPILHFGIGESNSIDKIEIRWPSGLVQTVSSPKFQSRLKITEPVSAPAGKANSESNPGKSMFARASSLSDKWHHENSFDDFSLQPLLPHRLSTEGPCMAWGDVNGDGLMDVFFGGAAGNSGELMINNGKGDFETVLVDAFFADADGEDAAAVFGDFDNDGDADLLVGRGSYEFKTGDPLQQNRLYLNDGSGSFETASSDLLPDSAFNTGTLAAADFDQDGDLDVFVGSRVRHAEIPSF